MTAVSDDNARITANTEVILKRRRFDQFGGRTERRFKRHHLPIRNERKDTTAAPKAIARLSTSWVEADSCIPFGTKNAQMIQTPDQRARRNDRTAPTA